MVLLAAIVKRTPRYLTNVRFTMRLHNDACNAIYQNDFILQDEFGRVYKHALQWGALTHILSDIPPRLLGDMEFIFMEVQSMLRLTNVKVSSRCRFTVEAVEAVNIVVALFLITDDVLFYHRYTLVISSDSVLLYLPCTHIVL